MTGRRNPSSPGNRTAVSRTLFTGVRVLDPAAPPWPAALETVGGRISWVGPADAARERTAGAVVPACDGAVLTPAFVDAHVHATASGLLVEGLDLTGARSPTHVLDAVAARVATGPAGIVWGHGWEEDRFTPARPPTRDELDRAAAGRPVYLSRMDVHSALVSTALVDRARDAVSAPGWCAQGPVSADAHHRLRRAALAAIDPGRRRSAQRAFLAEVVRRGVAVVHECAGPDISGRADLADLLAVDAGVEVVGYCALLRLTTSDASELRIGAYRPAARSAAPMIPASLSSVAGTIGARVRTCGSHFDDFLLTPPPTTMRSGHSSASTRV